MFSSPAVMELKEEDEADKPKLGSNRGKEYSKQCGVVDIEIPCLS